MSIRLRLLVALAALGPAASLMVTAPASAAAPLCAGRAATIVSSKDLVVGTSRNDVIVVRGSGTHLVKAGAGDDIICGSAGADTMHGGPGNDTVYSLAGEDVLYGGAGNDVLTGGNGGDDIFGGAGADRLQGEQGADVLQGGAGIDTVNPGTGENFCARDAADTVAGQCVVDRDAPILTNQQSPNEVAAGSNLTFMWSVSDEAGTASSWLSIGGASGWVTEWCGFAIEAKLIAGTPQAGTYAVSCAVPETAVTAEYTAFISSVDVFGNSATTDQFAFVVTGGVSDNRAPVADSVEVSSSELRAGDEFTVRYTVSDESGVSGAFTWIAANGFFADTSGRQFAEAVIFTPTLVSGDAKSGTYELQYRLAAYAPVGEYTIWCSLRDIYGNKEFTQSPVSFRVVG